MAYYGSIAEILNQWQQLGVFAYLLPFLMIFAFVYAILNKTAILGDNKGVQAVIAGTVGLLSLQFEYVPNFFASIFPYTGIGISILLVSMILVGMVFNKEDKSKWIWGSLGIIIFLVVLVNSLSDFSWWGYGYSGDYVPALIAGIVLVIVIGLIVFGDQIGKK